jgi:hypothetical protein
MMETLIVLGATCAVFFLFLMVFFYKEWRERTTGRRSGCQHHQSGHSCQCRGQNSQDSPTGPFLTGKEQ